MPSSGLRAQASGFFDFCKFLSSPPSSERRETCSRRTAVHRGRIAITEYTRSETGCALDAASLIVGECNMARRATKGNESPPVGRTPSSQCRARGSARFRDDSEDPAYQWFFNRVPHGAVRATNGNEKSGSGEDASKEVKRRGSFSRERTKRFWAYRGFTVLTRLQTFRHLGAG